MEDIMFGIILSFVIIAPIMALFDLALHFKRGSALLYEVVCYMCGIPLSVWLIKMAYYRIKTPLLLVYAFVPLATAAYLYMKYSLEDNMAVKAAKIISLVYSAVLAIMTAYIWVSPIELLIQKGEIDIEMMCAFYFSIVPVCYISTAISEIIFQKFGKRVLSITIE